MLCALESKGISRSLYQVMLLSYSDLHSFNYWQSCDQLPLDVNGCSEVRDDVIQFLDSHRPTYEEHVTFDNYPRCSGEGGKRHLEFESDKQPLEYSPKLDARYRAQR
jgi:hypothetical protein